MHDSFFFFPMSLQFLSSFASSLHRAHQTGRSRPSYNLPDRFTVKTSAYHQTVSKGNIETLALQSRCRTTGDRVVADKSSVDNYVSGALVFISESSRGKPETI